jgi:hypothetical protein
MSRDLNASDVPAGALGVEFRDVESLRLCRMEMMEGKLAMTCRQSDGSWRWWRKPSHLDIHRLLTVFKGEGR